MAPVYTARKVHDPAFIADVLRPGPNGRTFETLSVKALGDSQLVMFDGVTVADLPAGYSAYAGYWDGSFANLTALRKRFPNATIVSVTPDGAHGAMYIDVEPGDAVNDQIAEFIKAGGIGFYTAASNISAAISACTAAGLSRTQYKIWSAHWIGWHLCGPGTCGYPQADGTQFESTAGWDESLVDDPSFFMVPVPVFPIKPGTTSSYVKQAQIRLNVWRTAPFFHPGFDALTEDGVFGPDTQKAVRSALTYWDYSAENVNAGEIDQSLWNHLADSPAPAVWAYEAPQGLTARAGRTSVKLSWKAPAGSVPAGGHAYHAPPSYTVTIYTAHGEVASYPRFGIAGTTIQVGSLPRRTACYARVWAQGAPEASNAHYSQVDFTTG
jgi:hypothetical protein